MQVLIADDEAKHRADMKATVERLGHKVIETSDGDAAWSAFQLYRPPIVISDWIMPGKSGVDFCRDIRAEMRREKGIEYTYFILLTAKQPDPISYDLAFEMGVDDYLVKPFSEAEIRGRLRVAQRILQLDRRVQDLEMMVPICSYCKRIRKEDGVYEAVETFVRKRSSMTFSHGICLDCKQKHFPNI